MARLTGLIIALMAVSAFAYRIEQAPAFHLDNTMFQSHATEKRTYTDIMKLIQTRGFSQEDNRLSDYLADMKKDLLEEEAKHDELHATQQKQCEEEEAFRTAEISAGRTSRAAARVHRDLCGTERDEAGAIYDIAINSLQINQNLLDELERQRKAEITLYHERKTQLASLNGVFAEMIRMIDEFATAAATPAAAGAFVQKINVLLAMSIKFNRYEKVMPVYNAFIAMTNRDDGIQEANNFSADDVAEVRAKIEELQDNYNNAAKELEENEAANKENYETQKAELQRLIAAYENQRDRSKAYKERMQACFEQESDVFNMANEKVNNNVALRAHAREICQKDNEKYEAVKSSISRELRLLTQLEYAVKQLGQQYANQVLPKVDGLISVTETGDDNDGIDDAWEDADTHGLGN